MTPAAPSGAAEADQASVASDEATASGDAPEATPSSESQAPAPPPTVSFLDERPITLSLEDPPSNDELQVALHNDLGVAQAISLRVVGLEGLAEPTARNIFDQTAVSATAAGGGIVELMLPLGDTTGVAAGSYDLLLVASGQRGSLSRLSMTVTVKDPEDSPPVRGGQLSKTDVNSVTVGATNYLPSFLAPWAGAVAALAILLALALWAVWTLLACRKRGRIALAATAVLLAVIGGCQIGNEDLSALGSGHAISVRPLPTIGVADGTVGVAQDDSGRLVQLQVETNLLRPQGLDSAGVYKGKIDLDPGTDKGSADITLNVRDWWPWALLTLTAGLALGYRLRRWFEVERAQRKLDLRLERALISIGQSDLEFDRQTRGSLPFASMNEQLGAWSKAIREALENNKAEDAQTKVEGLEDYIAAFRKMRSDLLDVVRTANQIVLDWRAHHFDLREGDLSVPGALGTFSEDEHLDGPVLDDKLETLKAYQAKVEALAKLATSVNRLQTKLLAELDVLAGCTADADARHKLHDELEALGQEVLTEDTGTELTEHEKAFKGLAQQIRKLCPAIPEEAQLDAVRIARHRELSRSVEPDISYVDMPVLEAIELSTSSEVAITCRILAADGLLQDQIRPDDPLVLTVTFTGDPPACREVKIDLGEKAGSLVRTVPAVEPRVIEVPVTYDSAGEYLVQVFASPGIGDSDTALDELPISVMGEPRLAAWSNDFRRVDQTLLRIAFLVSVGSGLTLLYFPDNGWGQPQDYLAALLWGAAVSEGVNWATALASRTLPSFK